MFDVDVPKRRKTQKKKGKREKKTVPRQI